MSIIDGTVAGAAWMTLGARCFARVCGGLLGLLMVASLAAQAQVLEDAAFRSPMLVLEHAGQRIELSSEQLNALPQHRITTSTAWITGVREFQGPLMRDVLALAGIDAAQVLPFRLRAWDDYLVEMTADDYYRWDVILAQKMDGRLLTIAEFGPLCVIYPRDQHPELRDSRFDHRWVWMLQSIEVLAP